MPALFVLAVILVIIILTLLYVEVKLRIEYCAGEKTRVFTTLLFPRLPKFKQKADSHKMTFTAWINDKLIKAKFLKHIIIDELKWRTVIGLEDAMYTALGTGTIWACKGTLISYLKNHKRLKRFQIKVEPDFSANILMTELDCIIKMRIGYVILIIILQLVQRIKEKNIKKKIKANICLKLSSLIFLIK